jgi:hypothetical protein
MFPRSVVLTAALAFALAAPALGQTKDITGHDETPPVAPEVLVRGAPSPDWTQDRNFTGTRFWALDPGRIELESWWRGFYPRHAGPDHLFQEEVEIGLYPHIQLDVYGNFQKLHDDPHVTIEGAQIEARITAAEHYGEIWSNPTLYLEWHPRHDAADHVEIRLLFGGEVADKTFFAVNPIFEVEAGGKHEIDYGFSAGLNHEVVDGTLRLGAELLWEWAIRSETKHDTAPLPQAYLGPSLIWKPFGTERLKIMFTGFIGLNQPDALAANPQLIVGTQF